MAGLTVAVLLVAVWAGFGGQVGSERVLLLPVSVISHARQMMMVGEALADRGHDVYATFSAKFNGLPLFKDSKVKILLHSNTYDDLTTVPIERVIDLIKDMAVKKDLVSSYRESLSEWGNLCVNQLIDEDHYQRLKALSFDLAIVDVFPMSRCMLPLPYSLGIPYVGLETQYEPWLMGTPALPSFVPTNNLVGAYTPRMTFLERLHNLWVNIDWFAFPQVRYLDDDVINKYIRDKPYATMNELFSWCKLFLTDVDLIIDYPRPQLPTEIPIGGLTTKPGKPLPSELDEYMNSAEEGVILVSFGSYSYDFSAEQYAEFFSAFSRVRQRILWKHHLIPDGLPEKVKIMPWLPQNDILSHPNTHMFMTHCGNNGQFEALFHAVPMIGLPFFGDQLYNCRRIEYHGYGVCILDSDHFKADQFVDAVNAITSNSSYRGHIELASQIFRDRPMTPSQRASFWIEHVMRYGAGHLRSYGVDLPWYKYWMVDVLVLIFWLLFILVHCVLFLICPCVLRLVGVSSRHKYKAD